MSKSYDPYLAITVHYIDSQKGDPYEWQLKSNFKELLRRHSGENMATTISNVLDTYKIKDKVNNYSASNAMTNSFAIVAWMGYY